MIQQQHLVIGASGKTGSKVMAGLQQRGYQPRAGGRNSAIVFDWCNRDTWEAVLSGIDAVYLTYYPDLALPQAPDDIAHFCRLAKNKGVSRVTLLSGRGEPAAQHCEQILQNSGLSYTIIRASWFCQNFSEGLFHSLVHTGTLALPVSEVKEPFVDTSDIAEIAIQALTDTSGFHQNQLYEVTGPELQSFAEVVQQFNESLGTKLTFKAISLPEFQQQLAGAGVEDETIGALTYLFSEVLDGRNEYLTNDVQRALGRPATAFSSFLKNNAHYFEGA